ncbi:response regulator transcription factor [Photobacterium damselae]|uniref:response regulator transcription factor n=1 Tax=Photobacterium damselae TaxID=38293 RepID=UPI0040677491
MIRIAIFDCDVNYIRTVKCYFEERGFLIDIYQNANAIESALIDRLYDIMIINISFDAFSICKKFRGFYHGKILLISEYENDYNHIVALELGADDFLIKSINLRIMLSRVNLQVRELKKEANVINIDNIFLNNKNGFCWIDGVKVNLMRGDFDLLWMFMSFPLFHFSRAKLAELTNLNYCYVDRCIDNRVYRLRRILGKSNNKIKFINTVKDGYCFIVI